MIQNQNENQRHVAQRLMVLNEVLAAKDAFIKRLLAIVEIERAPGALTHIPIGAWDAVPDGGYVPPHAHLMMLIEASGFERDGEEGWTGGLGQYIPLRWVWAIHPHSITQDAGKCLSELRRRAYGQRPIEASCSSEVGK